MVRIQVLAWGIIHVEVCNRYILGWCRRRHWLAKWSFDWRSLAWGFSTRLGLDEVSSSRFYQSYLVRLGLGSATKGSSRLAPSWSLESGKTWSSWWVFRGSNWRSTTSRPSRSNVSRLNLKVTHNASSVSHRFRVFKHSIERYLLLLFYMMSSCCWAAGETSFLWKTVMVEKRYLGLILLWALLTLRFSKAPLIISLLYILKRGSAAVLSNVMADSRVVWAFIVLRDGRLTLWVLLWKTPEFEEWLVDWNVPAPVCGLIYSVVLS